VTSRLGTGKSINNLFYSVLSIFSAFTRGNSLLTDNLLLFFLWLSPLFKLLPWIWEKETTTRPNLDGPTLEYKAAMSPNLQKSSFSKPADPLRGHQKTSLTKIEGLPRVDSKIDLRI
jgi:hypothetical protein